MKFTNECFELESGKKYCNEGDKTLKFYVNSEPNELYGDYLMGAGDKILISYGSEEDIQEQLDSITKHAEGLE